MNILTEVKANSRTEKSLSSREVKGRVGSRKERRREREAMRGQFSFYRIDQIPAGRADPCTWTFRTILILHFLDRTGLGETSMWAIEIDSRHQGPLRCKHFGGDQDKTGIPLNRLHMPQPHCGIPIPKALFPLHTDFHLHGYLQH